GVGVVGGGGGQSLGEPAALMARRILAAAALRPPPSVASAMVLGPREGRARRRSSRRRRGGDRVCAHAGDGLVVALGRAHLLRRLCPARRRGADVAPTAAPLAHIARRLRAPAAV